jgi:hypothetical protein
MSDIDLSRLAPSDAVAALRSYPRRYRNLLKPVDDDDVIELAHRVGPDGRSSIEILSDVTRTLVVLRDALHKITVNDTPILHAAVVEPGERQWDTPPPDDVDEALSLFEDEANAMADAIAGVSTDSWTRTGTVAGTGTTVTALDVVRDAVRVGRAGLVDIERTLAAVRD